MIFLGIISLKFSNSIYVLLITIFQLITLLIFLIKRKYFNYYIAWVIFTLSSFEITYGQDSVSYNFRHFGFLGINLSFLTIALLVFIIILKKGVYIKQNNTYSNFAKLFYLMIGISLFIGVFNLLKSNIHIKFFIQDFYYAIYVLLIITALNYLVKDSEKNIYTLKEIIITIINSTVIIAIVSIFLGIKDVYSGGYNLRVLTPMFFSPLLIIISLYSENKFRKATLCISGIIGILITIIYVPSGKSLFMVIGSIIFYLYYQVKYKKGFKSKIILLILTMFIFISIFTIFNNNNGEKKNQILENKTYEIISLIDYFLGKKSLNEVSLSPAYRIAEFKNIILNNINNPIEFVFGNGLGGGFKDEIKFFPMYDKSAFSDEEYYNQIFFRPHEAINYILLKNGLLGIIILMIINIKVLKKIKTEPLGILGLIWIDVFYSYSNNIAIIGMVCLFISLKNSNRKIELN